MYSNVVFLLFQEDAEDRLVVADKLATAQEWLKELGRSRKKWMLTGRCLKPRITALLLAMHWLQKVRDVHMPVLISMLLGWHSWMYIAQHALLRVNRMTASFSQI